MEGNIKDIDKEDLSNAISSVGKEEVAVHDAVAHILETTQSIDETIQPDIEPNSFNFVSKTDQETDVTVTSDEVTITGIDTPTYITVSDSQESMYNINGGDFTKNSSLIKNGDKIKIQHTTSTNFSTTITTSVTIGGIVRYFNSTTKGETLVVSQSKSLLKTGQSESYIDKDDAYYASENIGVERDFTRDQTKEIVTDNATSLQWQDGGLQTSLNWTDASNSCQNLSFSGFDDWRLPTIEELVSISDKSKVSPAKFDKFQSIGSNEYWSSTLDISATTTKAWSINFGSGLDTINLKSNLLYVRCVREQ